MNSKTKYGVSIFADGADLEMILQLNKNPLVDGLTTNPTLLRNAGVKNYASFAKQILAEVDSKPVSFEVFGDNPESMVEEAKIISSWGENVYVKIPITNTSGETTMNVVKDLVTLGIKVNVTAIMTSHQVQDISGVLSPKVPSFLSIFAGRIADAGVDPIPTVREAVDLVGRKKLNSKIIWASPREILNVVQASEAKCDIITITHDLFKKLPLLGKNLEDFSLETVQMFHSDAKASGLHVS